MKTTIFLVTIAGFSLGYLTCLVINPPKEKTRETQKICLPIPLPIGDTLIYRENTIYVIGGYALDVNNVPKENEQ